MTMRDANKPSGNPRKAPWRSARSGRSFPWTNAAWRKSRQEPLPAPKSEADRGPARAVALWLVPALLIWTALIGMFTRLLK